jgi:hypothetical protein
LTISSKENLGRLNVLLRESIDETISTLFSDQVVEALYVHLQKVHSISKNEVPDRLEALSSALEKTFGLPSSRTIGRAIARRFFVKLGLAFTNNLTRTLLDYVEDARSNYLVLGEHSL